MSRSWEEEQALQQRYFDDLDRYDPIQHELDVESGKIAATFPKITKEETHEAVIRPAHNSPLSEKVRAKNLAMWTLRKARK
jgi:hypothetical protein